MIQFKTPGCSLPDYAKNKILNVGSFFLVLLKIVSKQRFINTVVRTGCAIHWYNFFNFFASTVYNWVYVTYAIIKTCPIFEINWALTQESGILGAMLNFVVLKFLFK